MATWLLDGEGDVWVPSNEFAPDGAILWQLSALMVPEKPNQRGMWIPIRKETIALRYGGAKVFGDASGIPIGNAQSISGG